MKLRALKMSLYIFYVRPKLVSKCTQWNLIIQTHSSLIKQYFFNHANLLKASFTLILILCFVSPMVFWNIGIVWPDEFLSSFKIYRHEKHRPRRPRKLVCLDYQKSWQNYGRKNIHIEYRIRWQKIIHTNEKEKFSLFSKWRVTENINDCVMSIFLLWIWGVLSILFEKTRPVTLSCLFSSLCTLWIQTQKW